MSRSALVSVLGILAMVVALVATFTSDEACADSWLMPQVETVLSPNGEYRFTVTPTPIDSQQAYYAEEAKAQAEHRNVERPAPLGLLERRGEDGIWSSVWAAPMPNSVAPVSVQVADDGRHIVTFDNWGSVGYGEDVIVIYGPDGGLIKSMPLTDLLPQDYIDALPHSVSSLRWRRGSEISGSGEELAIDVLVPSLSEQEETVRFAIALSDGSITLPEASSWESAKRAANRVNDKLDRAEEERLAYLRKPLAVPKGCDEREWHDYLREAHLRLTPDWLDYPSTSTTVLFPPGHERHNVSVGWLKDTMLESWGSERAESFASPCSPEALVAAVAGIVKDVEPGSLSEATFYVSIQRQYSSELAHLIKPTGAKLVWLDPETEIPQRPERIPGSVAEEVANAERSRRQMEDIDEILTEIDEGSD